MKQAGHLAKSFPPVSQTPMPDSTTYGERLQDHSAAPLLCPDLLNADDYANSACHWATTVTGWDANCEQYVAVAVTCKRWGCPYCAIKKIRRLAWMSKNATPTRLLTLTVSDKRYPDPESAWKHSSAAFPEFIRWARKQIGEVEYLRVLELQANGMPHYHCMLRCGFLVQKLALKEWRRLIGEPDELTCPDELIPKAWAGVNLKKIDDSFRTFFYLVKYLTKLHKIPWTDRHVSFSGNFFRPEDREEIEYAKLDRIQKFDEHPWVFLRERYCGLTVPVLGESRWLLGPEIRDRFIEVKPEELGLPVTRPAEPELPKAQKLVPGIDDGPCYGDEPITRRKTTRPKPIQRPKPASQPRPVTEKF